MRITHTTVSSAADSNDGKISSNAWNENHTLTGTANYLLGFDASGNAIDVDPTTVSSGGTWGSITGTLADQTDLNSALNAKADKATTVAGYGITDALTTSYVPTWASISGKPTFATVATTGAYSDLTGRPTLFSGAFTDLTGKPTTLAGYGITDAFGGTYTPTISGQSNVASSTLFSCQYMRVGNVVTVSGRVSITPTATGVTSWKLSLPIASALANANELAGTAVEEAGLIVARIAGATASPQAAGMKTTFSAVAAASFYFTYTYRVV